MLDFTINNTKLELERLGQIELKYISSGDMAAFLKIISDKNISDKEFVEKVIYRQLITPTIALDEVKQLADDELRKITQAFIGKNKSCEFKYYNDAGNLCKDFRQAMKVFNEKQAEELKKSLEPIFIGTEKILKEFTTKYSGIMQPFIDAGSHAISPLQATFKAVEQLRQMQKNLVGSFAPMVDHLKSITLGLDNLSSHIQTLQKWTVDNKYIFGNLGRFWEEFQKANAIAEQKALRILKRYKWFVTPGIPISFVYRIVKLADSKGRHDKQVNELFVHYFSEHSWYNLEQLVISWKVNPLFKKRMNIFMDCVRVLKKTKSRNINLTNVILPTLITQIDGLLSDYLKLKGIIWDVDYDDFKGKNKTKIGRKTQFRTNKSVMLDSAYDELANHVFLNILFQHSQKGKPLKTPFMFNRHKIMHGENFEYGRKDYLIRAFLVIDFLAALK